MDPYSVIARRVVAPLWFWREGRGVFGVLRELEESQYLPPQEMAARQRARLETMLRYAGERCPFYQRRFEKAGYDPRGPFDPEGFARIPPLTKSDVRAHGAEMRARDFPAAKLSPGKTGGSTSVPLNFFVDTNSRDRKFACALRHNGWAGWHVGDKVALVWSGVDPEANWRARVRTALLDRWILLDTLKLDAPAMHAFVRRMRAHKSKVLFGHSHSCYLLADFVRKNGYRIPSIKTVVSTSTVLADSERALMEDVFQCRVFDRYGCEETSLIASECERHDGMHLNSDHLYLEFLADGRPAAPGECGEIHVTDLTNVAMPFIRYRIEDAGTPATHACACGRTLPLMGKVQGRVADFLITPEGRLLSGVSVLDNFTVKFLGLERVQIVQERVDHLLFRIVRGEGFSEEMLAGFRARIPEFFGPRMRYDIEYVDQIPREASGKYRFTICRVPNPLQEAAERSAAGSAAGAPRSG